MAGPEARGQESPHAGRPVAVRLREEHARVIPVSTVVAADSGAVTGR